MVAINGTKTLAVLCECKCVKPLLLLQNGNCDNNKDMICEEAWNKLKD